MLNKKLMKWKSSTRNSDGEKMLYIYCDGAWIKYTHFDKFAPDYKINKGSKGYATFQALLKQGWKLLPSD